MAVEIERKFLVADAGWRDAAAQGRIIRQGYLGADPVQVRLRRIGDEAFLTIKGGRDGITRQEFEYSIPVADAEAMLALCPNPAIEKTRYEVQHDGHLWEIDVYAGRHAGLVIAEVELDAVDEAFTLPVWLGREVTGDSRFSNAVLAESDAPPSA